MSQKKEDPKAELSPTQIWGIIIGIVIFIMYIANSDGTSGGSFSECEDKATLPNGQWASGIYHDCMNTPDGFRW